MLFRSIEPFVADPFISEFCNALGGNAFVELYNPGNQPLDLRNYVIGMTSHADMYRIVTRNPPWDSRYTAYVPGLKFVDEATWAITPRILVPDLNVNPFIQAGGTFVLGSMRSSTYAAYAPHYDVQFENEVVAGHPNPWNEAVASGSGGGTPVPPNGNRGNGIFLYKILNDSVKFGLKPMGDRNDYEIIDVFAMENRANWVIGGKRPSQNEIFIRKPHITQGNPAWSGSPEGSFGTNPDNSEWIWIDQNVTYSHIPIPQRYAAGYSSLNQHYMEEPTFFKSTVNSTVYKVSDSFGPGEEILGIRTGTTVAEFLGNVNKEDEGQILTVTSGDLKLEMSATLNLNDILTVISADSTNTTVYRIDVGDGLSSDAVLTTTRYSIDFESTPTSANGVAVDGVASISGFDYGTNLKTIVNNIIVPAGASMTVIDASGAYVPFRLLNLDTTYVNVTVNPDIYFDVVAEDNVTRIVYQLQPSTSDEDAFILSDAYMVSQVDKLIDFVPRGTNFQTFLANITPSLGASLKLVDKMGFERTQGGIREDDKVVVTSPNEQITNVYFISFLPTEYIHSTTYLAYVLSDSYAVDQVSYVIASGTAGVNEATTVAEFYSNITPAMGATAVVVDSEGNEKIAGNLVQGDLLKVTSMDERITVNYQIGVTLTSTDHLTLAKIEIYPNPTSGKLNIRGLEAGNRIQIYGATGALLRDVKAHSNLEVLSLDAVPSGMFVIVISNKDKMLGRYKAIRK